MKLKHYILLFIIPLSEIKAIFYNSDLKVDWYLFSDNKRYLCNVVEDYSNIIIFCIVFWNLIKKPDATTREIAKYLLILNALDLIHLGLLDMQYFIFIKVILTYFICTILKKLYIF